MGESTKAVCALLMILSIIIGLLAWAIDQPGQTMRGLRLGAPLAALICLSLLLILHFRADLEFDYLRKLAGTYFNRDGFCFQFFLSVNDGIACLDTYWETQYDKPSFGQIALRPARGFFLSRPKHDAITLNLSVRIPPAAFGFTRVLIPIPKAIQGTKQAFEVGAAVNYPEGKGRRVRFHDGMFLRSNTNFENSFATAVTLIAATTGTIVLSRPATIMLQLPTGVADKVERLSSPEFVTIWQLGDPPGPARTLSKIRKPGRLAPCDIE